MTAATQALAGQAASGVRRHARRVALVATVVAGLVYLFAAAVGDFLVVRHLESHVDGRLAARLGALERTLATSGAPTGAAALSPSASGAAVSGDPDGAPVFSWWLPRGSTVPVALDAGSPTLASAAAVPIGWSNQTVDGHGFRFVVAALAKGRFLVATSVAQSSGVRTTLVVLEASLLPVLLALFFLVATVIGRGAATPIERARQEQLDFTADASHELRTPLAVIEAEVGLALSTPRTAPAYREALERIARESKRLRGIVDDLLWLARLDALPGFPTPELVDLGSLLADAAQRFSPIAASRSIALSCDVPADADLRLLAPAEWLDRLISVLLDNACRYSDEGGKIALSARREQHRVLCVVEDGGPGIAAEEYEDLTRRFHRASTVAGGAGLGLSIADTIVRQTGGTWQLGRSSTGGTRVEISWPTPTGGRPHRRSGADAPRNEAPGSASGIPPETAGAPLQMLD